MNAKPEAPLKEHVQIDTKERKEEREGGKEIDSNRSPEAETEKHRQRRPPQKELTLFQSKLKLELGREGLPWEGCQESQGHGTLPGRVDFW